jgi:GMP synthase (glutamine-hydrolysing)
LDDKQTVPIAILDFGSQFTHLISRRLRDAGVYCEIFPPDIAGDQLLSKGIKGLILSGGPSSVYDENCPAFNDHLLDLKVPILGVCYGYQLMAKLLGGQVIPSQVKEFGRAELTAQADSLLLEGLPSTQTVWMSHGDTVVALPPGFTTIAATPNCSNAAAQNVSTRRYGVQFHCEVAHSVHGAEILANFAMKICGCKPTWDMKAYADTAEDYIRTTVGDRNVFILVSGGIDSTVLFILLNQVLGTSRVRGLSIDTGLLRPHDLENTERFLTEHGMTNCSFVDASDEFLRALDNVYDPEEKRKTIGQLFLDVKDRTVASLHLDPDHWILAQGTIYPDIITSGGSKHASTIKTHHNALPSLQGLEVLEPLKFLYKDEVRKLAAKLGLPHDFIWRHPFPGPGIAVRIAGSVTPGKLQLYHKLDAIVLRHLKRSGWYERLWMGFPILVDMHESSDSEFMLPDAIQQHLHRTIEERLQLAGVGFDELATSVLPIRSVGVKGDYRTYEHPVEMRVTRHGKRCEIPHDITEAISTEIANRTQHVNRVLLAIKWLGDPVIWNHTVVLRMLLSVDTLTADWAKLEHELLDEIATEIMNVSSEISAVLLDVTQKPPGTMEWE